MRGVYLSNSWKGLKYEKKVFNIYLDYILISDYEAEAHELDENGDLLPEVKDEVLDDIFKDIWFDNGEVVE